MIIDELFRKVLRLFPTSRMIAFESHPDFTCNSYPVYLKLKEVLPSYTLVWLTRNRYDHLPPDIKVVYVGANQTIKEWFLRHWRLDRCRVIVSSNLYECKKRNNQLCLYLAHGSKTKKTRDLYENMGKLIDYVNVQSHFFDDVASYEYNCKKEQLVYLGYPRCDCFFAEKRPDVRPFTQSESQEQYIIWLPTFRTTRTGRVDAKSDMYGKMGMPIIFSIEKLEELNDFLRKKNIHILYKPHPAQDMTHVKSVKLSHFHFISDRMIMDLGMQPYEIIKGAVALITDYSSVFFDYLLLDRPIATTTDDLESWKRGRGFAFDIEKMYNQATVRVKDQDELLAFLNDVSHGIDRKKQGREQIRDITHMHVDGKSTDRVVEFICKYLEEHF